MPPLSWLGLGPAGELTKALDVVRKAVLTVLIVLTVDITLPSPALGPPKVVPSKKK